MTPPAARTALGSLLGALLLVPTVVFVLLIPSLGWAQEPCARPEGADSDSLFDYLAFYSCAGALPTPLRGVLLLVWLVLLISLLASTADMFFVPQLEAMCQRLGLPDDVAGVTLLALGNGMPDVMTATSSINNASDLALSMGEFLGAANFILSLVLGCVLLVNQGPTSVEAVPFCRDSLSYLLVLVFMVVAFWDGTIVFAESLLFPVSYVAYVAAVVCSNRCTRAHSLSRRSARELPKLENFIQEGVQLEDFMHRGIQADALDTPEASPTKASTADTAELGTDPDVRFVLFESDTDASAEDDPLEGFGGASSMLEQIQLVMELPFTVARHASVPAATWGRKRRALAAISPVFSVLLLRLSFQGWGTFSASWCGVPAWLCCVSLGLVASAWVLLGSSEARQPPWHSLLLLQAFVCAIAWFNLLANECVAVLLTFGVNFGVSSSVLGITVLAWGNSVGDLVADTALVKKGKARMAVAGCFGSPLLSELLGLGVALITYTVSVGELSSALSLQNKVAAGFVLASVLSTGFAFGCCRFTCPRWFGAVLLTQYAAFMITSVILELALHHQHHQELNVAEDDSLLSF